jgi:hypothetical protein
MQKFVSAVRDVETVLNCCSAGTVPSIDARRMTAQTARSIAVPNVTKELAWIVIFMETSVTVERA